MASKKPGKWEFLRGKFPALPEDPTYDEVKQANYRLHEGKTLEELAARINALEDKKAQIEQDLSGLDAELTVCERLMISRFDASTIDQFSTGGYSFKRKVEPVFSISDKAAMEAWYREHMPEKFSVNAMSVYADARLALDIVSNPDAEIPAGVTVNTFDKLDRKKA